MRPLLALLPPGFELRREAPLSIGGSEPEPDLAVLQGTPADWLSRDRRMRVRRDGQA